MFETPHFFDSLFQNQRLENEVLKSGKEVESFKTEMKKIESENKVIFG